MRKFYIFKILPEMAILTKDNPYNIFHNIEHIKNNNKIGMDISLDIIKQLICPLNINSINKRLSLKYQDNLYYQRVFNTHCIYNKYRPEDTKLTIKNLYILLETNAIKPSFFKELSFDSDLFVCDFENKDYFWINQVVT